MKPRRFGLQGTGIRVGLIRAVCEDDPRADDPRGPKSKSAASIRLNIEDISYRGSGRVSWVGKVSWCSSVAVGDDRRTRFREGLLVKTVAAQIRLSPFPVIIP